MYAYAVQQEDIDILKQSIRTTYARIELLNLDKQILRSIEGRVYNDNFSCSGDSAVRRTYNCDLIVTDANFIVGKDSYIWADKLVRVYYGVKHIKSQSIIYYLIGTFSLTDVSYSFSTSEKHLSITATDLMCHYNGVKGGTMIYGLVDQAKDKITVEPGKSIPVLIKDLCILAGIKEYDISGVDNEVIPYDIEWTTGTTYYQAWENINSLVNNCEFFFDEEGTFIWRKVPTGHNDRNILDDSILKNLIISEKLNDSFQNIYNATEVWGTELDLVDDDRYAKTCTGGTSASDNVYKITLDLVDDMNRIDNFDRIAIKVSGPHGRYININNLQNIPIISPSGNSKDLYQYTYETNQIYVFQYRRTLNGSTDTLDPTYLNFYLMGQFQCHGYYEENSPAVPYSIQNLGYKNVKVIENDKLYTDEYCQSQALYETYQTTAKQDSISLSSMIIPFLEPNHKFLYTPYINGETTEWIIKSISWSTMSGVMNIEAYRFLEDYSYVIKRTEEDNK